jgi:Aerobic-type carbon monoxide dehydrogenase, large subunit CoxL/CutL homologs
VTANIGTAGRFIGQSVHRKEDPRLLTGRGHFVDDIVAPGMLHAAFLRSDIARGDIVAIDVTAAHELPGVVAVYTAADLNDRVHTSMLPTMYVDGSQGPSAPLRPLADGDVRFVGEPIAIVIAENRYVAEDACELIEVDISPHPAVVDYETAGTNPELVHRETTSNVAVELAAPPSAELTELFATAPHVVTETFRQQRQTPLPMETRGVIADWRAADGELRIWCSTQNPHEARRVFSRVTGVPEHRVRVTGGDVGGGFGQKFFVPRDEQVVVLAAHLLGRPVKWIEDRRENLIASSHARADRVTITMAVDHDGTILGAALDHIEDCGAFPMGGNGGTGIFVAMLFPGPYRMGQYAWSTKAVWTNTCGRGAYRGPWEMETVAREQMMDAVARAIGVDPLAFRRHNVISREQLPHRYASGLVAQEVSPAETLEQAAELIAYDAFREEQARARAAGRLLGIGIGLYLEPQTGMGALSVEPTHLRVGPDGHVDVYLGSGAHGQGLETTTAQLVADHLGVHPDDVSVHQGDTASSPFGGGTGGSRSAPILGAAVRQASLEARAKVAEIAAHLLEAAPADIEMTEGVLSVRGTPSITLTLAEVARVAHHAPDQLPPGTAPGIEVITRFQSPPFMWSNACHVCTCEVDRHTGIVTLTNYVVSEDCGVMINPMIVEGQVAGGVAQGIGGALYEHAIYDADGNPLATTFLDYLAPTAAEIPDITYGHVETPSLTPGGHKGVGEGGAIGAPPTVFNAVADALAQIGAIVHDHPLHPSRVLAAIDAARARL